MRVPRVKLWQIMIAVALVAALAFGERMRRQRNYCRQQAESWSSLERGQRTYVVATEKNLASSQAFLQTLSEKFSNVNPDERTELIKNWEGIVAKSARFLRNAKKLLACYSQMRTFWEQAAAHPWLSVRVEDQPQMPSLTDD